MSLYGNLRWSVERSEYESDVQHIHTEARNVFDVSGAGDTVIATLAFEYAKHQDMSSAVRVANKAAGIVVGKRGTAVITSDELYK